MCVVPDQRPALIAEPDGRDRSPRLSGSTGECFDLRSRTAVVSGSTLLPDRPQSLPGAVYGVGQVRIAFAFVAESYALPQGTVHEIEALAQR